MTEEERNLLVSFFERNKPLLETTIRAMIYQAEEDGDTETANELKSVEEGLKRSGTRRLYTINGNGSYKMYEVVEEFIKYKLGSPSSMQFADIKVLVQSTWKVGNSFIGVNHSDVKIGSSKTASPHTFNFQDVDYYVTKELGDKKKSDNFYKFRTAVNKNEMNFQIVQI